MGLSEDILELREEYRIREAHYKKDGLLDDTELAELEMVAEEIKKLEIAYQEQAQKEQQKKEPEASKGSVKYESSKNIGDPLKNEKTSGKDRNNDGKGDRTSSVSSTSEIKRELEVSLDSIKAAIGGAVSVKWSIEQGFPIYAGVDFVLGFEVGFSASVMAGGEINWANDQALIEVKYTNALSGKLKIALLFLKAVEVSGNPSLTASFVVSTKLSGNYQTGTWDWMLFGMSGGIVGGFTLDIGPGGVTKQFLDSLNKELSRSLSFSYNVISAEFLKIESVKPKNDKKLWMPSELSITPGKALDDLKKAAEEYKQKIDKVVEALKSGAIKAMDIADKGIDEALSYISSLSASAGAAFFDIQNVRISVNADKANYTAGQQIKVNVNFSAENDDMVNSDEHEAVYTLALYHKNTENSEYARFQSGVIKLPEEEKIVYDTSFNLQVPTNIDKNLSADGWYINVTIKLNENSNQVFKSSSNNFTIN
jgi:hypothetical protein